MKKLIGRIEPVLHLLGKLNTVPGGVYAPNDETVVNYIVRDENGETVPSELVKEESTATTKIIQLLEAIVDGGEGGGTGSGSTDADLDEIIAELDALINETDPEELENLSGFSIVNKIRLLQTYRDDILEAIEKKGIAPADVQPFRTIADLIDGIILQKKIVIPSEVQQEVKPSPGYFGLESVIVEGVELVDNLPEAEKEKFGSNEIPLQIPADVLKNYPKAVIFKATTAKSEQYIYIASASDFFYVDGDYFNLTNHVVGSLGAGVKSTSVDSSTWGNKVSVAAGEAGLPIGTMGDYTYSLLWANHDVYTVTTYDASTGKYTTGAVYFANSDISKLKLRNPEYNGIQFPEITDTILSQYPYIAMYYYRYDGSLDYADWKGNHYLFASTVPIVYNSYDKELKGKGANYECYSDMSGEFWRLWSNNKSHVDCTIVSWANHDIATVDRYDRPDGTYFYTAPTNEITVNQRYYYNGIQLPKIPDEVTEKYQDILILKLQMTDGSIGYSFNASEDISIEVHNGIEHVAVRGGDSGKAAYGNLFNEEWDWWENVTEYSINTRLKDTVSAVWASQDIHLFSDSVDVGLYMEAGTVQVVSVEEKAPVYKIKKETLDELCAEINRLCNTQEDQTTDRMMEKLSDLNIDLQEITVYPTDEVQVITPDGYYGFSKITVEAVGESGGGIGGGGTEGDGEDGEGTETDLKRAENYIFGRRYLADPKTTNWMVANTSSGIHWWPGTCEIEWDSNKQHYEVYNSIGGLESSYYPLDGLTGLDWAYGIGRLENISQILYANHDVHFGRHNGFGVDTLDGIAFAKNADASIFGGTTPTIPYEYDAEYIINGQTLQNLADIAQRAFSDEDGVSVNEIRAYLAVLVSNGTE